MAPDVSAGKATGPGPGANPLELALVDVLRRFALGTAFVCLAVVFVVTFFAPASLAR